jgi:hypothetical protein
MSTYIKLSTLEFPRYEGDIRLDHPEISEGLTGDEFPCPETYAKVKIGEYPKIDDTRQGTAYDVPKLVNEEWICEYKIINFSPELIAEILKENERSNPLFKKGSKPNVIL